MSHLYIISPGLYSKIYGMSKCQCYDTAVKLKAIEVAQKKSKAKEFSILPFSISAFRYSFFVNSDVFLWNSIPFECVLSAPPKYFKHTVFVLNCNWFLCSYVCVHSYVMSVFCIFLCVCICMYVCLYVWGSTGDLVPNPLCD